MIGRKIEDRRDRREGQNYFGRKMGEEGQGSVGRKMRGRKINSNEA